MFKKTKVSHTTLQTVLKDLVSKKFVKKQDVGHQNVNYTLTDKGRKFLDYLLKLQEILK